MLKSRITQSRRLHNQMIRAEQEVLGEVVRIGRHKHRVNATSSVPEDLEGVSLEVQWNETWQSELRSTEGQWTRPALNQGVSLLCKGIEINEQLRVTN